MLELFPRFTQDTRLLRLSTPLGPERLLAECLRGNESLDDAYTLHLSALSLDAGIALKSLLGQPVLLELLTWLRRWALNAITVTGTSWSQPRLVLVLDWVVQEVLQPR